MIEFLKNNWIQLLEIVGSLVVGFLGGMKYQSVKIKNVSKVKGINNNVNQGGSQLYEKSK